jgi:hypothetical protein
VKTIVKPQVHVFDFIVRSAHQNSSTEQWKERGSSPDFSQVKRGRGQEIDGQHDTIDGWAGF